MHCEKIPRENPDPLTGRLYGWIVEATSGKRISWSGFYTGPLSLTSIQIEEVCHKLLGHGTDKMRDRVNETLRPVTNAQAHLSGLILHSTTPELRAFEGDLDALLQGRVPGDLTTYKETRSVYLARPGDLAVGRTRTWKTAVKVMSVDAIELPDIDHYYLSHALLSLASEHQVRPSSAINSFLAYLQAEPRQIRLYACEREMQIFLCWLAKTAGLSVLPIEANRPELSAAWNRKEVLHPTVSQALMLESQSSAYHPAQLLRLESSRSALAMKTGIEVPTVPGYTVERVDQDRTGFVTQIFAAARLLRERYGLSTGCLKASEAGDGARITPHLSLTNESTLERLGCEAYTQGDDYLLEAHLDYLRPSLAGQELPTALSVQIRAGRVAHGATVQFIEGTSWKGNVLLDDHTYSLFQLSSSHYHHARRFVEEFADYFRNEDPGLVLAGIDFGIGKVGGVFDQDVLLGVQDLNISFTGAECLRTFLDKAESKGERRRYGVTRVYRPCPTGDHTAFQKVTDNARTEDIYADTIASIPGRWAMVGITGSDPEEAMQNLKLLQNSLLREGLIAKS